MKKGEQLSPLEMAEFDSLEKEQLSKPQNLYIAGPRPNYKSQGQGVLNVPKDKMAEFKAKYLPMLENELAGSSGMVETILNRMRLDPKYPPQVIAALESRAEPLTTFAAYNLMTWLNDRRYGFGPDPEFNLLVDKDGQPLEKIDPEENKIRRFWKVEWFLKSAAQIGFNDVLSRRRREKGQMGLVGTLDAPVGDTGKTGAGQVTAGQKPKEILELPAKRRWLNSDPGSVARAGQKTNSLLTGFTNEFFAQKRVQLLRKFQGMPEIESDLKKAEKEIDQALQMAIELYNKYDKEYEASIPDELEREAVVMQKVHEALSKHESVSHLGIEDVMNKAKTLIAAGKTTEDDMQLKQEMDNWMNEFIKTPENKPISIPAWNENTKKAVSTATTIVPSELPAHPHAIAQIIAHVYQNRPKLVLDALKQWGARAYEKVVDMHDDVEKESSQIQEEWKEEMAYWEQKLAQEFKLKEPSQTTQTPQQPAAQPAAAHVPAAAAKAPGHSLPELLNWAGKVASVDDILKVGQALLDKKNELLAQKGSAAQVHQVIKAIRDRRQFINAGSSPQEYNVMNQLMHLLSDLEAAHEE